MNRLLCLFIASGFLLTGCAQETGENTYTPYSRTATLMGTFIRVKVYADDDKIIDEAFQLGGELAGKFNIYDPESEINRLNLAKKQAVSPELFGLLKEAEKISRLTGGKFDITVAPVLKAKGFYKTMPESILEEIPDTFDERGWKNVCLSSDGRGVALMAEAWIDLSGIAKGYVVDSMAAFFRKDGLDIFLIDAGGDIYCGKKQGDNKWQIGLREPGTENILLTLQVEDKAVATSGDYENYVVDGDTGETVSHIVDPLRHAAIKKELSSVTVISSTCAEADALATGMMAMEKEKAVALADTINGVEVIVVTFAEGKYSIDYSEGAQEYITWQK